MPSVSSPQAIMSQHPKRRTEGSDKKRRYRSDGTSIWTKAVVSGPGVWVSCIKGKEKQTVGEIYQLFDSIASEMWPEDVQNDNDSGTEDEHSADNVEAQIAKELASMKRPRKEQRFANGQTNTPCIIFISCKAPVDPVQLVLRHVQNVLNTGITHTRFSQRMIPVSGSCSANIPEIQGLCRKTFNAFFSGENVDKKFSYKIELRIRNHSVLSRDELTMEVAKCLPEGHTVDLKEPEIFVLVEVFKSVCGMSIVRDYYKLKKFNVMELAQVKEKEE